MSERPQPSQILYGSTKDGTLRREVMIDGEWKVACPEPMATGADRFHQCQLQVGHAAPHEIRVEENGHLIWLRWPMPPKPDREGERWPEPLSDPDWFRSIWTVEGKDR